MIHLDFRSSQPIYEQIITQMKFLILQGYLKAGDAIPSVRKLAMQLQVTPNCGKGLPRTGEGTCHRNNKGQGNFYFWRSGV